MTETATGSRPRVGVILLTLDQRDKTLRCLGSFAAVGAPDFRIVLLDNGSRDGTLEAVEERFPLTTARYSSRNLGVASGRNRAAGIAIRDFAPEFLFFLDNDMEVTPDTLSRLIAPLEQDPHLGQSTGKILMLEDRTRIYGAGGCYVDFSRGRTGHVGYGEVDNGQYDQSHDCLASGGCMMIPTRVFEELSGFDPTFDPYGPEDLDFGLRARELGYRGLYVPQAIVLHESTPGHTFEGGMSSPEYVRTKTRLWFRLMRRHARPVDWVRFGLWGAPVGAVRMMLREGKRGNLAALRGLLSGLLGDGKRQGS